jgi:hypothetical protein
MAKRQFNDKPPPGGFVVLRPLPWTDDPRFPIADDEILPVRKCHAAFDDDGVGSSRFKLRAILGAQLFRQVPQARSHRAQIESM